MSAASDILAVELNTPGYPPWIRLRLPSNLAMRGSLSEFGLVAARSELLVRHLAQDRDRHFPKLEKLDAVVQTIQRDGSLGVPALTVPRSGAPVSELVFESGRHRVLMLHELGATMIPVVVPWDRAVDFLNYLG